MPLKGNLKQCCHSNNTQKKEEIIHVREKMKRIETIENHPTIQLHGFRFQTETAIKMTTNDN